MSEWQIVVVSTTDEDEGLVPIGEIEVGDMVWPQDDETFEEGCKQVVELFVTPDKELLELTFEGEDGDAQTLRPNVREHDFGFSFGTGPNGGSVTRVRVHQSPKTGQIHGHPSGPERF